MTWQPIETAPKVGDFLVYMPEDKHSPIQVAKYRVNNQGQSINVIGNRFSFDMKPPTHWQPLPAPPEES